MFTVMISEKLERNISFIADEYFACRKLAGNTHAHRPPFFKKEREWTMKYAQRLDRLSRECPLDFIALIAVAFCLSSILWCETY